MSHMDPDRMQFDTRLMHAAAPDPPIAGSVVTPIFQSAMGVQPPEGPASPQEALASLQYIRLHNTPNHLEIQGRLASLEGAQAALVCASGMAAISASLLSVVVPGDHLLVCDQLYGGSHALIHGELNRLGVSSTTVDGSDPGSWRAALRPETKAFYLETMTNPLLRLPDLPAAAAFSKEHGLVSLTDNTLASPALCRPIEVGIDISLHSATKYLNGHSDILAGAVLGSEKWVREIASRLTLLGGCLDPNACFLLTRGLKTLGVRMERQCTNAQALAEFLAGHPAVEHVNYPGLPGHPGSLQAREWLSGWGGLLSLELAGGEPAARKLVQAVLIPAYAPSLGGTETLITMPVDSSHAILSPEERLAAGVGPGLVRVALGIEGQADLIEDFRQALESCG